MKLLKNAKIIDDENNSFKNVHILIDNKKISKIYTNFNEISVKIEEKDIINLDNSVIIPGFINSQSYLMKNYYYNNFKNKDIDNFEENYNKFINSLSLEEKFNIYKIQILQAIKNGVTTICDEDLFNLPLKKAVKVSGINCVFKLGYNFSSDKLDETLISKMNNNEEFIFSLKNVLFNSEKNFASIIKLSKIYNKPILINGTENLPMAGDIEKEFSLNNLSILENLGLLDVNHIINNSNVLDKNEIELLNIYNSKLIFSPSLNLNFGNPNANIYSLNKQNLIGISSFNNDYFLELFLARNLEKQGYNCLEVFSEKELINFSTINNAKILGLKNRGKIKEGYFADLIVLNNNSVNSLHSFIKNFDNRNIKSVFINGELVYNNAHFLNIKDYNKLVKNF